MTSIGTPIADWAWEVLGTAGGRGRVAQKGDRLVDAQGRTTGRVEGGVLCFDVDSSDSSIDYYRAIGGAHFHERAASPFAMSALDTPVYHQYLRQIAPRRRAAVIVDVGGGDGRNAMPWLEWGYERVVVIDPIGAALRRFRERVTARNAAWLKRILLIEADARALPLRARCADRVLAIESLYYLNEEYEQGLSECRKIMKPGGLLLLSDRDYEAGLLTRLLYAGLGAMLEMGQGRDLWDGPGDRQVRSRTFTRSELINIVGQQGLNVVETHGVSILSLLVGFLSQFGRLGDENLDVSDRLARLLSSLGRDGTMLRSHVLIARHDRKPVSSGRQA